MKQKNLTTFLFALLEAWKSSGHPVGVDTYLRVAQLMAKEGAGIPNARLKTLLAPLLCRNKEEQKTFYEHFDAVWKQYHATPLAAAPASPVQWRKHLLTAAALILGALLCWFGYRYWQGKDEPATQVVRRESIELDDAPRYFCLESSDSIYYRLPTLTEKGHVEVFSNGGNCLRVKPISVGVDSISLNYWPRSSKRAKKVSWVFTVYVKGNNEPQRSENEVFLPPIAYEHARPIEEHRPIKQRLFSFSKSAGSWFLWQRAGWWLALAVVLLLFNLFRNLLSQRKAMEQEAEQNQTQSTGKNHLKRQPNEHPPYAWQLQIPGANRIIFEEHIGYLIQQLRRRSEADQRVFDAPRSIAITARKATPTFLYRNPTQPDEYLLLIDIRARNDHRAQIFDLLYREFARQEVLVERFFYDGDLRLCWNEKYPRGLSLRELQHKHGEHRLVVVGNGECLINPLTGKLERWADALDVWTLRSLLTPIPIGQWSQRERELDTKFRLAPASPSGLIWLAGTDAAPDDRDIDYWQQHPEAALVPLRIPEKMPEAVIIAMLEEAFMDYSERKRDDRMLRWLAACAIPPVLHWDATLFFGKLLENDPRRPLLTLSNLQRLNRLTWFAEGKIPEKARRALLQWLEKQAPAQLETLRSEWKNLLEDNLETLRTSSQNKGLPPFEQSIAYEDLRLHILTNTLSLDNLQGQNMPLEQRRALETELDALAQDGKADFVALELLEQATAREVTLQTEPLPPVMPPLPGLLSGAKWQWPLFIFGGLLIWAYNPQSRYACQGGSEPDKIESVSIKPAPTESTMEGRPSPIRLSWAPDQFASSLKYQDSTYCLSGPQQQLDVYEKILCDLIDSTAMGHRMQLTSDQAYQARCFMAPILDPAVVRTNRLDTVSYYKNVGLAYRNAVGRLFRNGQSDWACAYYDVLNAWPWRDSALTQPQKNALATLCNGNTNSTAETQVPTVPTLEKEVQKQSTPAPKASAPFPRKNTLPRPNPVKQQPPQSVPPGNTEPTPAATEPPKDDVKQAGSNPETVLPTTAQSTPYPDSSRPSQEPPVNVAQQTPKVNDVETTEFEYAQKADNLPAYQQFTRKYAKGKYLEQARQRMTALEQERDQLTQEAEANSKDYTRACTLLQRAARIDPDDKKIISLQRKYGCSKK